MNTQGTSLTRESYGTYMTHSEQETIALGELVAPLLQPNDVLVLTGDLGAGKTHFTKGLAKGLHITTPITSPTFTVMATYDEGTLPLYHLDIYRVEEAADLIDIGFIDAMEGDGVCVIEWGDRFPDELPDDCLTLTFSQTYDAQGAQTQDSDTTEPPRTITISAVGSRSNALRAAIDDAVCAACAAQQDRTVRGA